MILHFCLPPSKLATRSPSLQPTARHNATLPTFVKRGAVQGMTDAAGMEASGPAEGGEGRGEQGCRETPVGPVSFTRGAAVQCGSGFALAVCADTGLVITSNPYTCTLSVFEITMSAPGTGSPSSRGPRTDGEGAAVDDSGDGQPSQSASPTFTLVRTIGRAGDGPLEFDRPCAGRACGRVHARAMSAPVGYSRPTRPSTLPHPAPVVGTLSVSC